MTPPCLSPSSNASESVSSIGSTGEQTKAAGQR
jgi:hypothetical protein